MMIMGRFDLQQAGLLSQASAAKPRIQLGVLQNYRQAVCYAKQSIACTTD